MKLHLRSIRVVTAALFPLFFAAPVLADVILVDASGAADADFTDLPPAFAVAHHNDLILIRAGNYSSFTTDKGVRVLGIEEGVYVSGISAIQALPTPKKFSMTNTRLDELVIEACRGHVALCGAPEQPNGWQVMHDLKITDSDDVRLRRCKIYGTETGGNNGWGDPAIEVINSEVELVACRIVGKNCEFEAVNRGGGVGLFAGGNSRVRLSLTNVQGGWGSDGCDSWMGNDGGRGAPALHVTGDAEVVVTGSGTEVIEGGDGGWGCGCSNCWGFGAPAIWMRDSAYVRVSGVILQPGQNGYGSGNYAVPIDSGDQSVVDEPSSADPTLEMIGDAVPGQFLTMRVTGPPGGNVRYLLGRIPELNYRVGGFGPDLLVEIRIVNPGTIPASGVRDYNFVLPGNIPQGMYFLGQATVVYQGSTYRTPSQVVLVR